MRWTVTVIVAAVVVLSLLIVFRGKYSSTSEIRRGSFQLDQTSSDLGQMKITDEKTAIFHLTNTSSAPITLRDFNTSCNCTEATVTVNGQVSPRFNMMMHMSASDAAWRVDLDPGKTAAIELIYTPSKMPVYGPVSRYLDFEAGGQKQRLTVSASVE